MALQMVFGLIGASAIWCDSLARAPERCTEQKLELDLKVGR
jgi:hypothetical protein